uniref:AF/R1 major pili subunit (afrA) n=1 Tax=Escherichia coli TaxID=562 RepID=Q03642_ECOLX|nr:AF/R1 major pili subunit (afrA) [Escherichia coli]
MKKTFIASVIVITINTGSAIAAQGDVQFFGTVTAKTCDLVVEHEGAVVNMIQLGSVTNGGTNAGTDIGANKSFTLKPASGVTCNTITTAKMAWSSPAMTVNGIGNLSGKAIDAHVKLVAINSTGKVQTDTNADKEIKAGQNTVDYSITGSGLLMKALNLKLS